MKNKYVSIIHKNLLTIILTGMIAIVIFSLIWPRLFYFIAQDELSAYVTNSLGECSVKISYMLTNHRATFDLLLDDSFAEAVDSYFSNISSETSSEIADYLEPIRRNDVWTGSISSNNNTLFLDSYGNLICYPGQEEIADSFRTSPNYSVLLENMQNAQSTAKLLTPYLPAIKLSNDSKDTGYIGCAKWYMHSDDYYCLISLTPVTDFLTQTNALDLIGITDYGFFCGDATIYLMNEDSKLQSLYHCAEQSEIQYETLHSNLDDQIVFTVLCSYFSEKFYLAANVDWQNLIYPFHDFFRLLQVCIIILTFLLALIFTILFQKTLLRLKNINTQIKNIQFGSLKEQIIDHTKDEIGDIADTINRMNQTIHTSIEEKLQSESEKSQLEYSLLVSAIDPHFIYNTLDTITFLAAMNKTQDIITVNTALIAALKDRIKMKGLKIFDTVKNEKEVLRQYIIIEHYLYSKPIDYEFIVSEADQNLRIPKNILQPLVENSIKHGLMPNKTADRKTVLPGVIRVEVKRISEMEASLKEAESFILLRVSDNGVGMDTAEKEKYLSQNTFSEIDSEHIGILNIRLRLQYLYHDHYHFQILDSENGGTTIEIKIPEVYDTQILRIW